MLCVPQLIKMSNMVANPQNCEKNKYFVLKHQVLRWLVMRQQTTATEIDEIIQKEEAAIMKMLTMWVEFDIRQ